MIKRIAVVLHHRDETFASMNYFIKLLIAEWEARGVHVSILRGIDGRAEADMLIPHLDVTVMPPAYQAFFEAHPLVVNRRLTDISKRLITRQRVEGRHSDWAGAVIVKTNYNACGNSERSTNAAREFIKRLTPLNWRKPLKKSIPWRYLRSLDAYPIFQHPGKVPSGIYDNPHLIVERFLPEREGEHYVLRNWLFFGGGGRNVMSRSFDPVVKAANTFGTEPAPVPAQLRRYRTELGADYGKFDYVIRNGEVVLYDVNRTPTFWGPSPSANALNAAREMANGLMNWAPA